MIYLRNNLKINNNLERIYISNDIINDLTPLLDSNDFSHLNHFLYYFHLIYSISISNRKYHSRDQFVQLSSWILQKVTKKAKLIAEFLEKHGFIEIDRHFITGKKCFGFKMTPKYQKSKFYIKEVTDLNLHHPPPKWFRKTNALNENHLKIQEDIKDLHFDPADKQKINRAIVENASSHHANDLALAFLQATKDKNHFFHVDLEKTGRVFSIFVNMPRYLRPYLRYKGEKLDELDIKNSQPLLLNTLYHETDCRKERESYRDITENHDLYDYLRLKLLSPITRDESKVLLYRFLFGWFISVDLKPIEELFIKEFPVLYQRIKEIKKENYTNLPVLLQKRESDVVINHVVKYARENNIPVFPIHDSFLTLEKDREKIRIETVRVFKSLYGVTPTLKVKTQEILVSVKPVKKTKDQSKLFQERPFNGLSSKMSALDFICGYSKSFGNNSFSVMILLNLLFIYSTILRL